MREHFSTTTEASCRPQCILLHDAEVRAPDEAFLPVCLEMLISTDALIFARHRKVASFEAEERRRKPSRLFKISLTSIIKARASILFSAFTDMMASICSKFTTRVIEPTT